MLFIERLFTDPLTFSSTILVVLLSITIHELAHGYAAISQGDDTPKELQHLTLNPVTHMGWSGVIFLILFGISWGQMPVNPSKFKNGKLSNIIVSAAGPLSNIVLCVVFSSLIFLASKENWLIENRMNENLIFVFYIGAILNFILCFFNLLPIPPLDGFHIFQEIFPPLRSLNNISYLPLVCLLIIFNIPGLWEQLRNQANKFIEFIVNNLNIFFSQSHIY
ncbi:MAG: site-2 protease family protein [Candidatus Caenarcaniphilales bacterium]|nr:site-2 protease family protein [Candidatus Caenarcaniphilales bacterium]